MLFPLPTHIASLGSAAPYWFPIAEGCSGDAPFCFGIVSQNRIGAGGGFGEATFTKPWRFSKRKSDCRATAKQY
jgi:hypothetical protein